MTEQNEEINLALFNGMTDLLRVDTSRIEGNDMVCTFEVKRRSWIKRLWRFPKTLKALYQAFRKTHGLLGSLYYGFIFAKLTLKRY